MKDSEQSALAKSSVKRGGQHSFYYGSITLVTEALRKLMRGIAEERLEGMHHENVDEHDDAKSEDEERELLDFHRVFARSGFGHHA